MFFAQPEIIKILQTEYMWSDDDIRTMSYEYTNTVIDLIIKESLLYIENFNLPEITELNKLLQEAKPTRGELATEIKLLRYVAFLPEKYPKLEELLKEKIRELDESLASDLISSLSEEAGIKIFKIIEQEINNIDTYQQALLNRLNSQVKTT